MRFRSIAALFTGAASATLGLAVAASPAGALSPASALAPQGVTNIPSNVWAGYLDRASSGVQIYSVAATFKVPSTKCTTSDSSAYFWAGLDGTDATVEQDGVAVVCRHTSSGNRPEYFDWYEMFPKKPVFPHHVSVGDTIVASVTFNPANGKYELEVDDRTHPADSFNNLTGTCPGGHTCRKNSAEVIAEDPGGGERNGIELANFGTVRFSQIEVISRSGVIGSLEGNHLWSADEYTMNSVAGPVMAKPSARAAKGTAFSVTFRSKG